MIVFVVLMGLCALWFSYREDWERVKISLLWSILFGIMMMI
jgi:hypothetical protein